MANDDSLRILTDLEALKEINSKGSSSVIKKTLDNGTTVFQADNSGITVSGSSIVSGSHLLKTTSSFANTAIITSSAGMYDVDVALHALDRAINNNTAYVKAAYEAVRYKVTGTLDSSGRRLLNLTDLATHGDLYFTVNDLYNVNINVVFDTYNDSKYENDLSSISLFTSASCLWVDIEAPASPNINYRLIAVNESVLPVDSIVNLSTGSV